MKPGVLQKLLSYVKDVHIESLESYYNESLQVLLSKGRYQLCTPNAIYSYADKYDNFRDSFARLDLSSVDNVLILGFGMGSIPYMLERIFNKNYTYTGVEIDASIIYLASKYVLDELKSEVSIVEADAWSYICQSSTKYDLVCIDIFVDDKIPDVFLTEAFLENVKENLSSKGILLFNHLAFHKKDIIAANQYFDDVFKNAFPNGQIIALKTNYVMLNDKSRLHNL